MRALAPTLAFALAVSGCKKDDEPTGTTFNGTIETHKDSTANQVPDLKLVHQVRYRAYVAWDPVLGEIVSPVIDGNSDYISAFITQLSIDGPPGDDTSVYCEVVFDLQGMTLAPNAKTEGFPWGLDIPAGAKDGYENCTDRGFDVDAFADGWKIEDWAAYSYSLRFYAPLTPALEDWLTPDTPPTDFDINHYTGGDWWSDDANLSTDAESNYWYGYAMDGLHNVDFDTRLDQRYGMLDINGDMNLGYYVFDQTVFWNDE